MSTLSLSGVAVLSNDEQKMVKGANALSCVATKGDIVRRYSTEDGHSELLVARWADVWDGFGYTVSCQPTYYLN